MVANTTYGYDAYDARGQLRKVSLPGGKTIAYVIDALGRRIAIQVDGKLKQAFVYDLAGRVRGELDASGTMASRFIYGARRHVPDYIAKDGVKLQLLTDARGSVRLVVDVASGQVVQRMDYDAWGNVLRDTSPGLQPVVVTLDSYINIKSGNWDAVAFDAGALVGGAGVVRRGRTILVPRAACHEQTKTRSRRVRASHGSHPTCPARSA
jgi:YD repeat-containing protein